LREEVIIVEEDGWVFVLFAVKNNEICGGETLNFEDRD